MTSASHSGPLPVPPPIHGRFGTIPCGWRSPERWITNDQRRRVFGVTVDQWKPGEPLAIGDNARGYPRANLKDIPPAVNYT
jgi:hypothetical protein